MNDSQVEPNQKHSNNISESVTQQDYFLANDNPLEVLWEQFQFNLVHTGDSLRRLGAIRKATIEYLNWFKTFESNHDDTNPVVFDANTRLIIEEWKKILLVLVKSNSKTSNFFLLHTVVSLKKPMPSLARYILDLFPRDILLKNDHGYIPLHLALLSYNYDIVDNYAKGNHAAISTDADERTELFDRHEKKQSDLILMLIEACPSSVTMPIDIIAIDSVSHIHNDDNIGIRKCQQYPLSLAIRKGMRWESDNLILQEIISLCLSLVDPTNNENIILMKDEIFSLYMFMLAAVNGYNSMNTVYMLLRKFPEVISF